MCLPNMHFHGLKFFFFLWLDLFFPQAPCNWCGFLA
uniref:Uncharacterized protein n=1 Tax=Rhizophora mucronata TaxID=61149 RepID=A0A2P2JJA4_RHIMU